MNHAPRDAGNLRLFSESAEADVNGSEGVVHESDRSRRLPGDFTGANP